MHLIVYRFILMYDLKSEGLIRGLKVLFVTICYTSFIGHM